MVLSNIHVIITCVNYCDFLKYTYPHNIRFFEKKNYYIITDSSDKETIEFCIENNQPYRFFNFFENAKINKSGAIHIMQKELHSKYPNDWILLLDADILLPEKFETLFLKNCLNKEALYSFKRKNYETKVDYELKQNLKDYLGVTFMGYMQLYFNKEHYYATYSKDCSTCDLFFRDKYYDHLTLIDENEFVIHLGKDAINVEGRISDKW